MKIGEKFYFFEIITFEAVAVIFQIYDENTCDLEWTCYQTVLRFQIWLREMFLRSIYPTLMENWDKSFVVQVQAVFGTRGHV